MSKDQPEILSKDQYKTRLISAKKYLVDHKLFWDLHEHHRRDSDSVNGHKTAVTNYVKALKSLINTMSTENYEETSTFKNDLKGVLEEDNRRIVMEWKVYVEEVAQMLAEKIGETLEDYRKGVPYLSDHSKNLREEINTIKEEQDKAKEKMEQAKKKKVPTDKEVDEMIIRYKRRMHRRRLPPTDQLGSTTPTAAVSVVDASTAAAAAPAAPAAPTESGVKDSSFDVSNCVSNPRWIRSAEAPNCMICNKQFGKIFGKQKHHCRNCGRAVCGNCSSHTMILNKYLGDSKPHGRVARTSSNPLRVCDYCSDQNNAKECKVFQQWCSDKGNICPGQMAAGGLTRIKNKHRRKPKKTIRRKKSHKRKPKKTIRRKKSIKRNKSYNKKPKKTIKRKKSRGRSRRRMR
jgi:hypothetical protein